MWDLTFVDVVLYLLNKKLKKQKNRKMENQTLTTSDLRLLMNMLDQQITILQMTSNNPRENESYIRLEQVKDRVINQLLEATSK